MAYYGTNAPREKKYWNLEFEIWNLQFIGCIFAIAFKESAQIV
jgi:hypothetical protein